MISYYECRENDPLNEHCHYWFDELETGEATLYKACEVCALAPAGRLVIGTLKKERGRWVGTITGQDISEYAVFMCPDREEVKAALWAYRKCVHDPVLDLYMVHPGDPQRALTYTPAANPQTNPLAGAA